MPPERIDILGLGAVAVDDLLFLEEFPQPDVKYRIVKRERHAGGLTGTALVAAARLGCRCAYGGTLGSDEYSRFIEEKLSEENVSTEHIVRRDGALPYRSTILVDMREKTRTILGEPFGVIGASDTLPEEPLIRSIRVLFVDHTGLAGMLRAARLARAAGIPVVGDFEKTYEAPFEELFALVDHLILPVEYAREISGAPDARAAAEALWDGSRSAVVVTNGVEGSWYVSRESAGIPRRQESAGIPRRQESAGIPRRVESPHAARYQQAYHVETVDTNGCGDVFHGAYAACLSRGMPMADRVRYASAAAAMKAMHAGGQRGIPKSGELEAFLAAREAKA
jgi:sugar/nucleoside kinase (ribokinase family)